MHYTCPTLSVLLCILSLNQDIVFQAVCRRVSTSTDVRTVGHIPSQNARVSELQVQTAIGWCLKALGKKEKC